MFRYAVNWRCFRIGDFREKASQNEQGVFILVHVYWKSFQTCIRRKVKNHRRKKATRRKCSFKVAESAKIYGNVELGRRGYG